MARRLRRGGYLTCETAAAARDRLIVPVLGGPRDSVYTVVEWLEAWVDTRARLRDSTRRMCQGHIRLYFRRLLDGVLLREHVVSDPRGSRQCELLPTVVQTLMTTLPWAWPSRMYWMAAGVWLSG